MARRTTIAGLMGNLRSGSCTRAVFEVDVEAQGDPEPVRHLEQAVRSADALLILSPECNANTPGAVNNAVDWLSRPYRHNAFAGRPTGIIGVSGGTRGGAGVLRHLSQTVGVLADRLRPDLHPVGNALQVIDNSSRLVDEPARDDLTRSLRGFLADIGS